QVSHRRGNPVHTKYEMINTFICVFVGGICLFQIYTDSLYSPDSDFVYSQYLFKNFLLESIVDLQYYISFRFMA
ncbi:hypothetical protein ACVXKJ_28405, partial [Klebsiella pneumoniae]